MSTTTDIAEKFFETCESGQGWEPCQPYCHADAAFSCQSGVLAEVSSVAQYAEWMKGMQTPIPDAGFAIKAMAEDSARGCVVAFAVFTGTHTGPGGPIEATGKTVETEYAFIMQFDGEKIKRVTKVWNDAIALAQLGWV